MSGWSRTGILRQPAIPSRSQLRLRHRCSTSSAPAAAASSSGHPRRPVNDAEPFSGRKARIRGPQEWVPEPYDTSRVSMVEAVLPVSDCRYSSNNPPFRGIWLVPPFWYEFFCLISGISGLTEAVLPSFLVGETIHCVTSFLLRVLIEACHKATSTEPKTMESLKLWCGTY